MIIVVHLYHDNCNIDYRDNTTGYYSRRAANHLKEGRTTVMRFGALVVQDEASI